MGLPKPFTSSPYGILPASQRWTPDKDDSDQKKSLPPLVAQVRQEVENWRNKGYPGLSKTTSALLEYWFETPHFLSNGSSFQYFFSQRESVESIVYIYEIKKFREPLDLLYFDHTKSLSPNHFKENWLRLVCKQATGTGKTKVLSLLMTWCYFHKKYETDSELSTNFLLITPNIIVLDRIRSDFEGLKIFSQDPLIPKDGFYGKHWKTDFRMTLHIQDDLKPKSLDGNIFLSNIHRVYEKTDSEPSFDDDHVMDYFIGPKPVSKTIDSKYTLSELVRGIDDLVVLNDEAHHIHDSKLSWFSSIQDINNRLLQKGKRLSLQIDVTATPKKPNGSVFPHVISDYPLVEAIAQGVVKAPVIPDEESRAVLNTENTGDFAEDHASFLKLGVVEWQKAFQFHQEKNKKAVLFVMVDETKNCKKVKNYLELRYKDLIGKVFIIHTKKDGNIYESSTSKKETELKELRKIANEIDKNSNQYTVIISVLMLKEGWDVKNVTTIVGLRAYTSHSKILPEQTLGRGLRRMYFGDPSITEKLSVIGTSHFMDFVNQIKHDGVILNEVGMGIRPKPEPLNIKVDHDNPLKNISDLDIHIPILDGRIQFSHKSIKYLELDSIKMKPREIISFEDNKAIEICFKNFIEETHSHYSKLPKDFEIDAHHILDYLTREISTRLRLFGEKVHLYEKLKHFASTKLFGHTVKLDEYVIIRNVLRPGIITDLLNAFRKAIVELTAKRVQSSQINHSIILSKRKDFTVNHSKKHKPTKCVFNYVVGDSHFEMDFAAFLDKAPDVLSFTKCFKKLNFKLEYVDYDGNIVDYYPDFVIQLKSGEIYVVETKGDYYVDENTDIKRNRLKCWCADASNLTKTPWKEAFILASSWEAYKSQLSTFNDALRLINQEATQ